MQDKNQWDLLQHESKPSPTFSSSTFPRGARYATQSNTTESVNETIRGIYDMDTSADTFNIAIPLKNFKNRKLQSLKLPSKMFPHITICKKSDI